MALLSQAAVEPLAADAPLEVDPAPRVLADSAAGVAALLAEVGDARIKWVEVFRDHLVVHPAPQSEGAAIAAQLGITVATDYPATRPGFTMWTGTWSGMDLFVYGDLRGATRAVRAWPT